MKIEPNETGDLLIGATDDIWFDASEPGTVYVMLEPADTFEVLAQYVRAERAAPASNPAIENICLEMPFEKMVDALADFIERPEHLRAWRDLFAKAQAKMTESLARSEQ